jgi:hypothetical protein
LGGLHILTSKHFQNALSRYWTRTAGSWLFNDKMRWPDVIPYHIGILKLTF